MLKMKKFLCEYESIIISFVPHRVHLVFWNIFPPLKNKQLVVTTRLYSFILLVCDISHGVIVHAVKENCGAEMAGYIYMDTFSAPRSVAELLYFAAIK